MRMIVCCIVISLITSCGTATSTTRIATLTSRYLPALPHAITNNAVTAINTQQGTYLVSFNGLARGKQWQDTSSSTFILAPTAKRWHQVADVPGDRGLSQLENEFLTIGGMDADRNVLYKVIAHGFVGQ